MTELASSNVSESSRTEIELKKKVAYLENCLNTIIDSVPGSVYWKDVHGVYIGCNNAFVLKANLNSKQNIIGKTDQELWPEYATEIAKRDKAVIDSNKAVEGQEHVQINTGENFYFWSSKSPLVDEYGQSIGLVCNSLDITEVINAKQQAEAANIAKDQFLLNMQHDIKTPISNIIGLAEILRSSAQNPETIQEYVNYIHKTASSLMGIVVDMLEFARLENEKIPHQECIFDLKEMLQKVVELNSIGVVNKGLKILVEHDQNIAQHIIADRYRLHRILINLFANAVKFTDHGTIKITTRIIKIISKSNLILELSVEDSGIGIAEDKYEVIFDRFTRLTDASTSKYEGSGLGLYIVKQFIKDMGGEVSISSKIGEGTKFSCIFPCKIVLLDQYNKDCK